MSKEKQEAAYRAETSATEEQLDSRKELQQLFLNSPLPTEDLMFNLGLYIRSPSLAKFLVLNDLYERINGLPGAILEFGTWWGQNLILFESLRAIHEPFNKRRVIVGFDTFSGYTGFSDKDLRGEVFNEDTFSTQENYKAYLEKLLETHEGINVLGHIRNVHRLIKGDVRETAPQYFKDHPETVVALAYFDLGLYLPTKAVFEAIKPHLVPGSTLLLDEFTWLESPGEAIAFKEVFSQQNYRLEKCKLMPLKTIVTIK